MLARRAALAALIAGLSLVGTQPGHAQGSAVPLESSIGDPAAPVTMIEYASLTCPHCAAFHEETLPGLKERYIDTGKVRLIFRDFPLDQMALQAAMIAHCAGPERHLAFVDVFFAQQESWSRASDPVAALKQLARLGGLGEAEIDACLADAQLEEAVLQTRLQGQNQFDIQSTPTFIIDGKAYPGSRSVEEFAAIIDPLLNR
jgi:protein-disulfide isomerase